MRAASSRQVRLFALSDQAKRDAVFDDSGHAEKVYGQWVSGDAFAILGVKPALGRVLASTDDINPGQHPVAVLSYDFWTRRFGRNPDVLGRWVTIREKPLQIVGVAAKGFTGVEPGIMTDVWAPTMMWDDRAIADPDTRWFRIWGRMQAGVAEEQARTVLQSGLHQFRPRAGRQAARGVAGPARISSSTLVSTCGPPRPVHPDCARTSRAHCGCSAASPHWCCSSPSMNVASLLVARAAARQREMALRASIGAGRGRLIQQALIESGLLALTSCALGAVLSVVATPKIVSMISTSATTVRLDVWPDWRVLVFLGAMGILVTFLFGLAPALHASAAPPADALKSGGRHATRVGSVPASRCRADRIQLRRAVRGRSVPGELRETASDRSRVRREQPGARECHGLVDRTGPGAGPGLVDLLVGTPGTHTGDRLCEPVSLGVVHGFRTQQERADPGSTGRCLYPVVLAGVTGVSAHDANPPRCGTRFGVAGCTAGTADRGHRERELRQAVLSG